METLIPGLVGGLLLALGALVGRLIKGRQLEPRDQIQRDIELRNMLDRSNPEDLEAWSALTVSIRSEARELVTDTTDWMDRWGLQWLPLIGLVLVYAGISTQTSLDDLEELAKGWVLLAKIMGYTLLLVGNTLLSIWGIRIFQNWRTNRTNKKAQKENAQT